VTFWNERPAFYGIELPGIDDPLSNETRADLEAKSSVLEQGQPALKRKGLEVEAEPSAKKARLLQHSQNERGQRNRMLVQLAIRPAALSVNCIYTDDEDDNGGPVPFARRGTRQQTPPLLLLLDIWLRGRYRRDEPK
jgi:hypothetical protein